MGVCLDKLPHSCGTTKGLQVFADEETGKINGFCFSCGDFISNPYGTEKTIDDIELPKSKTQAEIDTEIAEVSGYQVLDLPSRKLRSTHLNNFGVKVGVSEQDGKTPELTYFPITKEGKVSGYYVKTIGKPSISWAIGDVKGGDPFGWQQAKKSGAYRLIITEGLEDAVAVEAICDRHGSAEYKPAVVSLTNGVRSINGCLSHVVEDINNTFKEVVLCFDNDKVGQEAVSDAMILLPNALSVTLPEKDANDCILKGCQKQAYKALSFNAKKPKNTRLIIAGGELHAAAREPTPYGELTWPYAKMNKLMRNMRKGETIYIGAGVKMGKSELLNDIAGHLIKEHDVKVLVAKPEEASKKTYKLMCNKMVGKVFHDPDVEFDYDDYDRAGSMLKDKLIMLDLYQHLGWETLKKDITHAASMGVEAVFIDPITNLTNGMTSSDANVKIQEIAQELAAMALDLNIVIFIFVHLKANDGHINKATRNKAYDNNSFVGLGNCPHETGGDIYSAQFSGSRAMMRSCNLMIGLEGNKDPDLDISVRNSRWLTILEDREFGNNDSVALYWNKNTTWFKEV